jgi:isopenicillin N synthase-like dioxygenase
MTASNAVVAAIGAAATEMGFFTVTGHGVPAELLGQVLRASGNFLALPPAAQLQLAQGDAGAFLKEHFDVIEPSEASAATALVETAAVDPAVVDELRAVLGAYQGALTKLSTAIMDAVADSLDLTFSARSAFAAQFDEPATTLAALPSHALPAESGFLTVTLHAGGGLVARFGPAMERMTGGLVPAVAAAPAAGLTLPFAFAPRPGAALDSIVEHLSGEQKFTGAKRLARYRTALIAPANATSVEVLPEGVAGRGVPLARIRRAAAQPETYGGLAI